MPFVYPVHGYPIIECGDRKCCQISWFQSSFEKLPSPEQLLVKDDLVGVQSQQPDHRTGIPQIEHIKMILVPEMNSYRFQEP